MKWNKLILSVCLLGSVIGITGCGSEDGVQRYAWPLATCSTEDTITHVLATNFAEQVSILSDGKMEIQVYSQSTLGSDRELLESCEDGDIPFVAQSPATQVSFMSELCIFDTPCIFESETQLREAVDNEEFQELVQEVYVDGGYQLLALTDQSFRVMTSQEEFTGFESFSGQKIRVMENAYHIQFWKQMGANPTPMTFSEVYIALQQGSIDAQENSYDIIQSAKLYEQQDYIITTNAVPDYISLIVSDEFMKGLDEDEQEIIRQAARNAKEIARESVDNRKEKSIEN